MVVVDEGIDDEDTVVAEDADERGAVVVAAFGLLDPPLPQAVAATTSRATPAARTG